MPEKRENSASFQTQTINGLVILFYKNLLMPSPKQYTTAFSLCKALAKRFNENEAVEKLNSIARNTTIGYPLGLLQTIVYRDLMLGKSTNRMYNYGYKTKMVQLGDMILALDTSLDRILDVFTEICVKYDIDTSITTPIIEGLNFEREGGLI